MRPLVLAIASLSLLSLPARADTALLDVTVAADSTLVAGTRASIYISASRSRGLRHSEPTRATARARLVALDDEGEPARELAQLGSISTGADGQAVIGFRVPAVDGDRHALVVSASAPEGRREKVLPVSISTRSLLVARTDRGIYRPGSTLRWRVSAIHRVDAHPLSGLELDVAIRDPRGTAIWRGAVKTDAGGMASGQIPLSADIRRGGYRIAATARKSGSRAIETFRIADVKLPPFAVSIDGVSADAAVGEPMTARVKARYLHGEPVSGRVEIRAAVDGMSVVKRQSALDRFGAATLSFAPPIGRRGRIEATVTDGAGRTRSATADFQLPGSGLELAIIPERKRPARGRQRVTVITANERGDLVPATVRLWHRGATKKIAVKSPGAAVVKLDLPKQHRRVKLQASAVAADGRVAEARRSIRLSRDTRFVRVRRPLIRPGERIGLTGRWPDRRAPVFATLLRRGVPVATMPMVVDRAGRLRGAIKPPPGVFGLVTVRVVELPYHRRTGALAPRVATRSVYLQPGDLDVDIEARLRHRPGSRAAVGVTVSDRRGRPVPAVHLAASVVDERILALSEPRPDLVEVLEELDTGRSKVGSVGRRAGVAFAALLARADDRAHRIALRALLDALPPSPAPPAHALVTEAARVKREHQRMVKARAAVKEQMLASAASFGARARGDRWRFGRDFDGVLAAAGWKRPARMTPWKRPTSWGYAAELVSGFDFPTLAGQVIEARLDELAKTLGARKKRYQWLISRGKNLSDLGIGAHLVVDPWGKPIELKKIDGSWHIRSAGPDQKLGTKDDRGRTGVFSNKIGLGGYGVIGHGSGGGYGVGRGSARGGRARAPKIRVGNASVDVKVRKRFDETVLWVTGVKTDAAGKATLAVDLADSITGWQIDVEAIGPRGQIGTGRGRLETALPRYADPAMPRALTIGDRYTIPVVVANHHRRPGKMRVAVTASGAVTLRGPASRADRVPPRATRALGFPIEATRSGTAKLRVDLFVDGKKVDAIERTLKVRPPGRLVRARAATVLTGGAGSATLAIPNSIATGTAAGTLRVFRHAGDRALDGIDKLVREPHGCFEQTTSATYPNLLVVRLLGKRKNPPAAVARAREYVARGYQRLISYEVEGGGFSWFGKSPANQVLTAYGLMEFSDMLAVYPVDPALIARTREWLLSEQRRDGAWGPDASWLHDWSAAQGRLATTAYVSWALAESGYRGKGLRRALRYLGRRRAQLVKRPYLLALWAAAESLVTERPGRATRALAAQLERSDDGYFVSARGATLFYAKGRAADAQVTALAATAWFRAGMGSRADKALDFVLGSGGARGWGSTQGTVLALRAAAVMAPEPRPFAGKIQARVNGRDAGVIDLADRGALGLAIDRHLRTGDNTVALSPAEPSAQLPAELGLAIDGRWRTDGSGKASERGIAVTLAAKSRSAARGRRLAMKLSLENPGNDDIAMPTAVIPIPPGFRFVPGSLRGVARVEDVGSEVRVYLEKLAAGQKLALGYQLEAQATCRVTQRPVEAYAYYTPKVRGSSAALVLRGK